MPCSSLSVACGLFLVDLGEREPDVDEDPVTGSDAATFVGVQEADIHIPLDPGDVDSSEPVSSSTTSMMRPGMAKHIAVLPSLGT